jgi:hypothetical protein
LRFRGFEPRLCRLHLCLKLCRQRGLVSAARRGLIQAASAAFICASSSAYKIGIV